MAEFNELVIELQGEYKGVTEAFKQLTTTIGGFSSALKTALAPLQQYKSTLDGLDKIIKSQSALGKQTNNSIAQTGAVSRKAASDTDILYKKINALAVAYDRLGQKSTAKRLRSLGAESTFSTKQREALSAVYATQGLSKDTATALNATIMAGTNQEIQRTGEVAKTSSEKTATLQRELNKLATVYAKLGQTNRAGQLRQFSGTLGLGGQQQKAQQLASIVGLNDTQSTELSRLLLNPQQIEQALKGSSNALKDVATNSTKAGISLKDTLSLGKFTAALYLMRRIGNALANVVKEAIDFVETLNLFQTALGSYAGQATEFVNKMSTGFGMSETTLMKYTGLFYQMATSMGVANENAYVLSENFTKLAVDLASYFNISIESANEKLQAALAGQIRPLRELGLDISETALQEEARRLGIEKSIEVMTAAEKIQLRYNAITRQSKNAHGDFAKTIGTVSNQTKILSENMLKLKKAWGEILMPALEDALPIVNGLVSGLTYLGQSLANIAGYKVKEFGGALNELGELDEEAENVLDTVNKLNKATMGFDELNILSQKQTSDNSLAFELKGYENGLDGIRDIVKEMGGMGLMLQNAFKGIGEALEKVAPLTVTLGSALLTYFSINAVGKLVAGIGKIGSALTGAFSAGAIGAIAAVVAGAIALVAYFDRINKEKIAEKVAKQLDGLTLSAKATSTVIGDLDGNLSDLYNTSMNAQSKLKPLKDGLDTTKESADDFLAKFDEMPTKIPDNIDKINEALDGMTLAAQNAFTESHSIIYSSWEEMFMQSSNRIDEDEQALLDKLAQQGTGVETIIADIGERIKQLYKEMANDATGSVASQMEEIKKLRQLQYDLANEPLLVEQEKRAMEREEILEKMQGGEYKADDLKGLGEDYLSSMQESIEQFNELIKQRQAEINVKSGTREQLLGAGYSEDYLASIGYSEDDIDAMTAALESFKESQKENIGDESTWQAILGSLQAKKKTTASEMEKKFAEVMQRYKDKAPWYLQGIYKTDWAWRKAGEELGYSGEDVYYAVKAEQQANAELQKIIDELMKQYGNLPAYASGGYPELGELFVANEFGIEAMGKVGGRTAVVNNQQIALALGNEIYPAMYNAIVDGLRSSGGLNGNTIVKIGNDVVAKATKDGNRYAGNNFSTLSGGNVI